MPCLVSQEGVRHFQAHNGQCDGEIRGRAYGEYDAQAVLDALGSIYEEAGLADKAGVARESGARCFQWTGEWWKQCHTPAGVLAKHTVKWASTSPTVRVSDVLTQAAAGASRSRNSCAQ